MINFIRRFIMAAGVYRIINAVAGKSYIGSTKTRQTRWYEHRRDLRAGKHHNPHLQHAWARDGESAWVYRVLEECEPSKLLEREAFWISQFETLDPAKGYNICHPDRHTVSAETRARISASSRGKTVTAATGAKISASLLGKKRGPYAEAVRQSYAARFTPAVRARMSAAKKGKPGLRAGIKHTPLSRAKMAAA